MGIVIVDNQYLEIAKALIEQAKNEICIASFKLEISEKPRGRKLKNFFEKLVDKIKNGVKIKVLINWHDDQKSVAKTNLYASHFLKNHGAEVKFLKNNRCCHAKILIVDKEKAVIGSHNLSIKSTESNFEISYLTQDPETVKYIYDVFNKSFYEAKKM